MPSEEYNISPLITVATKRSSLVLSNPYDTSVISNDVFDVREVQTDKSADVYIFPAVPT